MDGNSKKRYKVKEVNLKKLKRLVKKIESNELRKHI
jgi:exonuclease VII small subunit